MRSSLFSKRISIFVTRGRNKNKISGPEFQYSQLPKTKSHLHRKKAANANILETRQTKSKKLEALEAMIQQNGFYIDNLEEPYIEENISIIKKEDGKVKKFKEFVEFYMPK